MRLRLRRIRWKRASPATPEQHEARRQIGRAIIASGATILVHGALWIIRYPTGARSFAQEMM